MKEQPITTNTIPIMATPNSFRRSCRKTIAPSGIFRGNPMEAIFSG